MAVPGPTELALILVIVLFLFGAGKLPQVFEAFGSGIARLRGGGPDDPDPQHPVPVRVFPDTRPPVQDVDARGRDVRSDRRAG